MIMNTMRMRKNFRMERKSVKQLCMTEQVAIYLHNHPECLTERLMTHIAAYFMNYGYIRMRIKEMYRQIIMDNVKMNKFVVISEHSDEEE